MKPFPSGDLIWPAGQTRLHVYLLPELAVDSALGELVAGCRAAMAGYPVAAVADPWLHITVQMITGRPAQEIGQTQRAALRTELAAHLADLPSFTLIAGSPLAGRSGVILDLSPDKPFREIHERTRAAICDVLGPGSLDYDAFPAHLALAYATGHADSDFLQSALRRVRPSHAPVTISAVHVVDVDQDARRHQYRWIPVATVALGPLYSRRQPELRQSQQGNVAVTPGRLGGTWESSSWLDR